MKVKKIGNAVNGMFERKISRYKNPEFVYEKMYAVVSYPRVIISEEFIDCLGVSVFDTDNHILGFAHIPFINFPRIQKIINDMIESMERQGASAGKMQAKLCGETYTNRKERRDSLRKYDSAEVVLAQKGVAIKERYLGKGTPQDIIAHSVTGELEIYNSQLKEIVFI